jgi:hypothetical protein
MFPHPVLLCSGLLVSAALAFGVQPSPASPPKPPPPAEAFARPDLVPWDQLVRDPDYIRRLYGPPSAKVGADLWVYWNFSGASRAARDAGFDTLAVHVRDGEVISMRLVNGQALRTLLASVGAANRRTLVAGQP